jgi:hypothetical protein
MTATQTMSPLDPAFLHLEDDATHMHIGSVGIFEGPAPGPHEMAEAIARSSAVRAPRTARLSQKGIDQRTNLPANRRSAAVAEFVAIAEP